MIDKQYDRFILVCDCCDYEVKRFDTFNDVVEYKRIMIGQIKRFII